MQDAYTLFFGSAPSPRIIFKPKIKTKCNASCVARRVFPSTDSVEVDLGPDLYIDRSKLRSKRSQPKVKFD